MSLADVRRPPPPTTPRREPDRPGAARPPRSRTEAPRGLWKRSALLGGGILAALAGLHVTLDGEAWWFGPALVVLLVLGTATVLRQVLALSRLASLGGGAVGLAALTLGFAPDTALLGFVPWAGTFPRFGALAGLGLEGIQTQRIPADATFGITFLIAVLAYLSAVVGEILVARVPALGAIPLLVVLAVPVIFRAGIADPVWFAITMFCYLGLLRVGLRRASPPSLLAAGTAVLIGAVVAPIVLPPVEESAGLRSGTIGGNALNPILRLGDDLRRADPVTALQYTTDSDKGVYLRLTVLDDFDGTTWEPAVPDPGPDTTVDQLPRPSGLEPDVIQTPRTISVEMGDIVGSWLPLPYPATAVDGVDGDWFWEPDGLAVRGVDSGVRNQDYRAEYLELSPSSAQLAESLPATGSSPFLALPEEMPAIILETAQRVAGGAATRFDRAVALQEFFTGGTFVYSEEAPVENDYDGTGVDVLAEFLERREGYCVHFASAMAVMARSLGIPARVAVGFQPGEAARDGERTVYTVSTHDLHAWPELYFEGIGWLRFEPTPGRGSAPSYSLPVILDDPTTPGLEGPVATAAPTPVPGVTPGVNGVPLEGEAGGGTSGSGVPLAIPLLGALALVVLLAPAITRAVIRARRIRSMRWGRTPAAAAWAEVRDTARDHGWVAPDSETPRDLGDRLEIVLADGAAIRRLRVGVEAVAYGPGDPGRMLTVEDLAAVRWAIARASRPRDRIRAVLLPSSLLARFGLGSSASAD